MATNYRIKIVFFLAGLLLFGAAKSPSILPFKGKVTVLPNRSLGWEDFKKVDNILGKNSINALCLSTCDVDINRVIREADHVKLEIEAKIKHSKELSQVALNFLSTADEMKKNDVLHHENGHFIIAQIIGYRIVRDANAFRFHPNNYKSQLNVIIKENFKDWRRLDSQYDAQTTKPNNPEMQNKWDKFFVEEMNALIMEIQ